MTYRVDAVTEGTAGGPFLSVFNFSGTPDATTAQQAADAVASFFTGLQDFVWSVLEVRVEPLVTQFDPGTGDTIAVIPVDGTTIEMGAADTGLPYATQGLIRWRTGVYVGGREIRGRTFVPGATEAMSASGRPTPEYLTGVSIAADTLVAAAPPFAIWSPTRGQDAEVLNAQVWSEWAVLRSRRD